MKKPHFLLVNDDGITAPGISALYESIKHLGKVTIIAPASQKSGAGLSFTLHEPVTASPYSWHDNHSTAYSVKGTPVDCIKFALALHLKEPPDMVISGINPTINSGRNVLYSGTIGAIIEATYRNIPGIAFSIENRSFPETFSSHEDISSIVNYFLKHPMEKGSFVNVSFPHTEKLPYLGFRLASQGKSFMIENPNQHKTQNRSHSFYVGGKWLENPEEENSDVKLMEKGFIAVVPISVNDLTHHGMLKNHKTSFEQMFPSSKKTL